MSKRERIEALENKVAAMQEQVTQLMVDAARKKIPVPEVTWEGGKVPDGYKQNPANKTPPDIKHFEQKAHQPRIRDLTKESISQVWIDTAMQQKGPKPFANPRRGVGM